MKLIRKTFTEESTIGELQIGGKFECYTLEDKVRAEKIAKVTAIPMGRYQVDVTYSNRFKCQMPILLNVPGFTGIRIHAGNTAANTDGCILVGQSTDQNRINNSRAAYTALFEKIQKAKRQKETISLEITDMASNADRLLFNGRRLSWIRDGKEHKGWAAVSGRSNYQSSHFQSLKGKGPIPAGIWLVLQREYQKMPERSWIEQIMAELGRTSWPGGESSWGRHRIWLKPKSTTSTFGRTGFSIHGGDSPGSAGCIDLTYAMPDFASEFLRYAKDMELVVDYGK